MRFKHAIVRDVAYEMLLFQRRRELHGAAGAALEQRETDRIQEHVERLAHHFARSDDRDKAVHYLVRSGDKAVGDGAMLQALGQYIEAVRILGALPETPAQMRRRIDITMKLSHRAIYRPSKDLREVLGSCLELSERIGDEHAASYSLYWMAWLENALGSWTAAREYFERCTVKAHERGDEKLLSLIYGNLGETLFHTSEYAEALRLLEESARMRRKISGETAAAPLISYPIAYQAMIHAERGHFDLAIERLDEARKLARESGRVYTEAAVVGTCGVVELWQGDWPACRKSAAELERKSKRIGSNFMLAFSQNLGGYARCFDGQRGHRDDAPWRRDARAQRGRDDDLVPARVPGGGARARRRDRRGPVLRRPSTRARGARGLHGRGAGLPRAVARGRAARAERARPDRRRTRRRAGRRAAPRLGARRGDHAAARRRGIVRERSRLGARNAARIRSALPRAPDAVVRGALRGAPGAIARLTVGLQDKILPGSHGIDGSRLEQLVSTDLAGNSRPTRAAPRAPVILPGNELAIPAQQGIRRSDG
jgi:tetratricopeptide (TPR) repeat protein